MAETAQIGPCLVIGYGNELRGDDGLGPETVRSLEWEPAEDGVLVERLCFHQLDVILAEQLSHSRLAIFVDARDDGEDSLVKIRRIRPASQTLKAHHATHVTSVESLLAMARDWYGHAPPTFAVLPKGYRFEFGEGISIPGREAESRAQRAIRALLRRTARIATLLQAH